MSEMGRLAREYEALRSSKVDKKRIEAAKAVLINYVHNHPRELADITHTETQIIKPLFVAKRRRYA